MERYVNIEKRGEFVDAMHSLLSDCHLKHREACLASDCKECMDRFYDCHSHLLPSANVVPVKIGKWDKSNKDRIPLCTRCGEPDSMNKTGEYKNSKFCPNCGAIMRDVQNTLNKRKKIDMEWKYVKNLESADLISEFEELTKYILCDSFKECVVAYNGGRPSGMFFDTNKNNARAIKTFLSFNKTDKENVWDAIKCDKEALAERYIPFAVDYFGNSVCFDTENNEVVFIDHENTNVEIAADDFDAFLRKLYDSVPLRLDTDT